MKGVYDTLRSINWKIYKSIPALMPIRFKILRNKSGQLLDIGCGVVSPQRLSDIFGEQFQYTGVDIQDLRSLLPKSWSFYQLDLEKDNLPFSEGTFDVVIMSHVLEHISVSRAREVVSEAYRVLKPGGLLYCEVPSLMSIFMPSFPPYWYDRGGTLNFYDDFTHVRPYSKMALWGILTSAGFKVVKIGTVRSWLKVLAAPFGIILAFAWRDRNLLASFLWEVFGFSNYAIAVKEVR